MTQIRPLYTLAVSTHMCVCLCVFLCVCSLLRYRLNVFLPPFPKIGCPKLLEIRNPWGKVIVRRGLRFKTFTNKGCKIAAQKKFVFGQSLPYWACFFFSGLGWTRGLWSNRVFVILRNKEEFFFMGKKIFKKKIIFERKKVIFQDILRIF